MGSKAFLKLSLCFLLGATLANADEKKGVFFIEPQAGYALAGSLSSDGNPADSFSGMVLGGRLGLKLGRILMIGGSAKYAPAVSYIENGTTTAVTPKPTMLNYGAFLGASLPRVSVWGGYNFSDVANNLVFTDSVLGTGTLKMTGTSYFFGAGVQVVGPVHLNAEYVIPSYTKVSGTIAGIAIDSDLTSKVTGKYVVVSLSAPLQF